MKKIAILLFNDFETLDVFGPVEIFGRLKELYAIEFYSFKGGLVSNSHNVQVLTKKLGENLSKIDIFLIPGGYGTRIEINNKNLIDLIETISKLADYVLTVCTGTSLLAKTKLLNGLNATTNKRAFDWVITTGSEVNWIKKARWVVDGKFYTSAGVSAGMDMTLGFISDILGVELARKIAYEIEYTWQEDKDIDEFYLQELA